MATTILEAADQGISFGQSRLALDQDMSLIWLSRVNCKANYAFYILFCFIKSSMYITTGGIQQPIITKITIHNLLLNPRGSLIV